MPFLQLFTLLTLQHVFHFVEGGAAVAAFGPVLKNVRALHQQYHNIFKHGNRNAASHLWSAFLINDSSRYTEGKLKELFSGFCAISGSPVNPNNYNRYGLTLPVVPELAMAENYDARFGFLHYCCWPCVCDTQDFLRVDSKTITTSDKGEQKHFFVTIGNPCNHPEKLTEKFYQPSSRGQVTLQNIAPEVRCGANGELIGAIMSDHGYVVIGMFFDSEALSTLPDRYIDQSTQLAVAYDEKNQPVQHDQPGRVSNHNGVAFQSEMEYDAWCLDRERRGHNSGMGEIFRKVAAINSIGLPTLQDAGARLLKDEEVNFKGAALPDKTNTTVPNTATQKQAEEKQTERRLQRESEQSAKKQQQQQQQQKQPEQKESAPDEDKFEQKRQEREQRKKRSADERRKEKEEQKQQKRTDRAKRAEARGKGRGKKAKPEL